MIDHMLFNLKKYYEGKFPCYIGMNIKAPKSGLSAYYIADSPVDGADMLLSTEKPSLTPAELENKEVIAQRLNGLDDFYLMIQPAGDYSYINCWIKLSDLVKNGGVSASLTHVCHALSLVRKELSMAIEKMLFNLKTWLPQAPGKWYKCEGGDGRGFAWLYQYDSKHSFWSTVYKAGGPNDADTLSKDVAARVDDENIVTGKNGFESYRFVKITECPSRPDVVGEYLDLNDLVKIGGVISLLTQLYQGFQCVFTPRKVVLACR